MLVVISVSRNSLKIDVSITSTSLSSFFNELAEEIKSRKNKLR